MEIIPDIAVLKTVLEVSSAGKDIVGNEMPDYTGLSILNVEMLSPFVSLVTPSAIVIDNSFIGSATFYIDVEFSEDIDGFAPEFIFPVEDPSSTLIPNSSGSEWILPNTYRFYFDVAEGLSAIADIDISISDVADMSANEMATQVIEDVFSIDIASGLTDLEGEALLIIYPNPVGAGNDISIALKEGLEEGVIRLIDPLGHVIEQFSGSQLLSGTLHISTNDLATGNYIIQLSLGEVNASYKVMISE